MTNYLSDFINTKEIEDKRNHLCVVASVALIYMEEQSICLVIEPDFDSLYGTNFSPYISLCIPMRDKDTIANIVSYYGYGLEDTVNYLDEKTLKRLNSHSEIFVLSRIDEPTGHEPVWALDYIMSKDSVKEVLFRYGG